MNGLLFIDDEEGVRRSIARALKKSSYPIHTVKNGEEGIEFIKTHLHDITTVISDYKMPGLDGMETLTAIGTLNPGITRILLTGYATMEAAINATNEGLDGFLTKPFDNLELRAKIHEIMVHKHLRQFIPEQIYREIDNSPEALRPRFNEVSVLFSDIRGFTRMSGTAPPEKIAAFLNTHYFSPMGEIAYTFNGTMDKHIGDSIMVVFGSPVTHDDDAVRAVESAIAMQIKAARIDQRLAAKDGLRLKVGIGIATGTVFSGILGSLRKKEFSSIGMAVNIASRLQAMAGAGEILISEETYSKIEGRLDAIALPPVMIKGIDEPMTVYKVNYQRP